MTLEQRIEALEQAVKVLVGGEFTVENGQVFIQKAFIEGGKITAANLNAAGHLYKSNKTMEVRDENGAIRFCCQSLSVSQPTER